MTEAAALVPPESSARPGEDLRGRVARGTAVNAVYATFVSGLGLVKGFVIAALLTTSEFGLWSLLAATLGTLLWLAQIGINDKYIQQDHDDQVAAFQLAFTLQAILATFTMIVIAGGVLVFALAYDRPEMIKYGLVLALAMPVTAFQAVQWAFYRRMDFVRQRLLEVVDPVATFVLAVALSVSGFGVWGLVIATLGSSLLSAAVCIIVSPYPLRFRYERGVLQEYVGFSWPVLVGSASAVASVQVPAFLVNRTLGLASVGAIGLAAQLSVFTSKLDGIVSHALYPAICAAKDRPNVLFESFSKSNRLALLWGLPVGVGIALFADDIVHLALGDKWLFAVPLIRVVAVSAGVAQVGFSWGLYLQAQGITRPIALHGLANAVVLIGLGVPLLLAHGLGGYAFAVAAATGVTLAVRLAYLMRMFPAFSVLSHMLRPVVPTLMGAGAWVGLWLLTEQSGSLAAVAVRFTGFVEMVALASWLVERELLREVLGYMRRAVAPARA